MNNFESVKEQIHDPIFKDRICEFIVERTEKNIVRIVEKVMGGSEGEQIWRLVWRQVATALRIKHLMVDQVDE